MNKRFKVRSANSDLTVDSVSKDFARLGKRGSRNRIIIGAGIGLAVLTCTLNWEVKNDTVLFSVNGSHGVSGVGIIFVVFSLLFSLASPLFFGGILILLIIYYLEIMQIKQKISEEIDNIKFKFE